MFVRRANVRQRGSGVFDVEEREVREFAREEARLVLVVGRQAGGGGREATDSERERRLVQRALRRRARLQRSQHLRHIRWLVVGPSAAAAPALSIAQTALTTGPERAAQDRPAAPARARHHPVRPRGRYQEMLYSLSIYRNVISMFFLHERKWQFKTKLLADM